MVKAFNITLLSFSLFLLIGCTKVKEPEFRRISDFKVKSLGLQEARIGISVVYFNPNGFGVNVKEGAVNVYFDSTYIGQFTQPTGVEVKKNAEFAIPLEGSVPIAKALKLKASDILNKEILVRADGSVRVGKGGIFVSKDIKYQGKHKLDLNL
ncbi:NDR1/HIN1-like protein [Cnuella takakiae]|nr:LEA type 2 family protein [Cnuella takakiae]